MSDTKALGLFLENPQKYISTHSLPRSLPRKVMESELKLLFPKSMELLGYCAVTLLDGPSGIIRGCKLCIVEYKDKLYAMADESKADRFMRTPWKFEGLHLPNKLPPKDQAPIATKDLPVVGYLEQTLSTKINEALKELGRYKPKYPFMNLQQSSSSFLAMYFKGLLSFFLMIEANNPQNKEWQRKSHGLQLSKFKDDCELIEYLAEKMDERIYIPPQNREFGFDKKLSYFLALKKD